jgi:hypothetical protein
MRLNSKVVGIIVLVVMFGGILITTGLGWWHTEGGGRGAGNHNGASGTPLGRITLQGTVNSYDQRRLSITTEEGKSLYIELGSPRYNRSIGFAPQSGERVTVQAFFPGSQDFYNAITVALDATGRTYAFRDALGNPLWVGKNTN